MKRAAIAAILGLTLLAGRARADDEDVARARERFGAALKLEDAGDYRSALDAFQAVGTTRMTPQVRYHIGLCLEHVGRLREAAEQLTLAEDESKVSTSPEQQIVSARAGQRAAQIRARTPKLVVHRDPSDANAAVRVDLDGKALALTNDAAAIDPGAHEARVYKGDALALTERFVAQDAEPGQTITLVLAAAVTTTPPKATASVAPWIAGGVAVAFLAGAGVTAIVRKSAISDLESGCGDGGLHCPQDLAGTYDRVRTTTVLTNVLLVSAAVSVVATGVLWLVLPSKARSEGRVRTPFLTTF